MSTTRYWIIVVVMTMLGLAACAYSGGDEPSVPATMVATTSTTQRTATTEGPTTTVEASEDPLVYVVMGNSLLFSTPAVMYAYRDILAEDLGVQVDMRDHTVGGQATADFLEKLQTNDRLRTDLAEADVILFLIPNGEWKEPCYTIMAEDGRDPADCGGDDGLECLRSVTANYNGMVERILAELTALADPAQTVIRAMDYYVFTAGEDDVAAVQTLGSLWRQSQDYVEMAAARYGIPVAQVFDEFMSPDGAGIPEEKGLVSTDGVHVTAEGSEMISQMIRGLGYGPADGPPPGAMAVTGELAAPAEYIHGPESGEPLPGGRLPHTRGTIIRGPITGLSDDRVNGYTEQLMDIDFFVEGDRSTGLITIKSVTITNDGGTWEGAAKGTTSWTTTQPGHRHHVHYTLLGTGEYKGLRFTFHAEGIDYPWTVTGVIEPVDG